jgi:hypothetical protein
MALTGHLRRNSLFRNDNRRNRVGSVWDPDWLYMAHIGSDLGQIFPRKNKASKQVASCQETATRSEPLGIGDNSGAWLEGGTGPYASTQIAPGRAASRCAGRLHAPSCAIILGAGRPSARRASPEDDSADDGRMNQPRTCRPPHGRRGMSLCSESAGAAPEVRFPGERNLVSESCRPSPLRAGVGATNGTSFCEVLR